MRITRACISACAALVLLSIMSCEDPDYGFVGDPTRSGISVPAFSLSTDVTTPEDTGPDLSAGDISFVLTWELTWDHGDGWYGWGYWSWDSGYYVDMDIWVKEPNGETLSSSKEPEASGLGPTATGGVIDLDDDGHELYQGTSVFGPERAFWPDGDAPLGTYEYGVRYFSGTVTALWTLEVYFGAELQKEHKGQLIDPEADTSPEGPRITAGNIIFND